MIVQALFGLLAPLQGDSWNMPHDASSFGWKTDWLINITIVFVAILFAIMLAIIAVACIRHSARHRARYSHGNRRGWVAAKLAIGALIFLGVDGNLFVNSTLDLHSDIWNFAEADSHPQAVRIEINAHQWAWDARYAGPDGRFNTPDDIITLNDIRVPEGVPVIFQLGAVDVLHSLYIPNLRVKQDVVPGTVNWAWFQATETGEFDIACAQHCGTHHYKMKALLTVLTREEYAGWAREASTQSERAYDAADESAHWGWKWQEPPHAN